MLKESSRRGVGMHNCSFCGNPLKVASGKMFVRTDGKIFYFCRSKCEKNWEMGRIGKDTKWTSVFEKGSGAKQTVKIKKKP